MIKICETENSFADPSHITDSAFKQQRLPAWQPILTAGTVLPTFFVIGIAFIPVGVGLLYFSDEVQERVIDYTNCISNNEARDHNLRCTDVIAANSSTECYCLLTFVLPKDFNGKVFMYYGLTNFYQNHRRYVKSRDDNQLLGHMNPPVSSDCAPFAEVDKNGTQIPIAPCGAIANSLFSDELSLYSHSHKVDVPLLNTGIAWPTDKEIKFKNPAHSPGQLKEAFRGFEKPKMWKKPVYELDPENEDNNGFKNEDLIVWMRTAALPTFRKLYRRIDHSQKGFTDGLLAGNYTLKIKYCKFYLNIC